jgi:hypothetical protein
MDGFSFVLDESNMVAQRAAGIHHNLRLRRTAPFWQRTARTCDGAQQSNGMSERRFANNERRSGVSAQALLRLSITTLCGARNTRSVRGSAG